MEGTAVRVAMSYLSLHLDFPRCLSCGTGHTRKQRRGITVWEKTGMVPPELIS